jgi:hypothetical protein
MGRMVGKDGWFGGKDGLMERMVWWVDGMVRGMD